MTSAATPICREVQARHVPPGNPSAGVNVGETERLLSAVGGGLLALYGLGRGGRGGLGLIALGGALTYRGLSGHCSLYQALGVNTSGRNPATSVAAGHGVKVEKTVTVDRPPGEVFRFWRRFENLPRFMGHLREVRSLGGNRSRWVAEGPMGGAYEWDAEVINERPDELIAWRSLQGAEVDTAGSVHFRPAPGGRGTEVHVVLKYDPPAGRVGAAVASLFGVDPGSQIEEDLRRLKQALEPATSGAPGGVGGPQRLAYETEGIR